MRHVERAAAQLVAIGVTGAVNGAAPSLFLSCPPSGGTPRRWHSA